MLSVLFRISPYEQQFVNLPEGGNSMYCIVFTSSSFLLEAWSTLHDPLFELFIDGDPSVVLLVYFLDAGKNRISMPSAFFLLYGTF